MCSRKYFSLISLISLISLGCFSPLDESTRTDLDSVRFVQRTLPRRIVERLTTANGLESNTVISMMIDSQGRIFVVSPGGTIQEVGLYSSTVVRFDRRSINLRDSSFVMDNTRDRIYAAVGGILYSYDQLDSVHRYNNFSDSLNNVLYNTTIQGVWVHRGVVYIASSFGLLVMENDILTRLYTTNSIRIPRQIRHIAVPGLVNLRINTLAIGHDGRIHIGTPQGYSVIDNNVITTVPPVMRRHGAPALPDSDANDENDPDMMMFFNVSRIIADNSRQRIYVVTSGLVSTQIGVIENNELVAIYRGGGGGHLQSHGGIPRNTRLNYRAMDIDDRTGYVYIGTEEGALLILRPDGGVIYDETLNLSSRINALTILGGNLHLGTAHEGIIVVSLEHESSDASGSGQGRRSNHSNHRIVARKGVGNQSVAVIDQCKNAPPNNSLSIWEVLFDNGGPRRIIAPCLIHRPDNTRTDL